MIRTSAIIIIGNEILSGRTQDKNINVLATGLADYGINLMEVRVVSDQEAAIVKAAKELSAQYDYVFTSGGIGPTHDDITAASLAVAFSLAYETHPEANQILRDYYADKKLDYNPARQRMAKMPLPCVLIPNNVSGAPGFQVENVFVLPGVPHILKRMFEDLLSSGRLEPGAHWHSNTMTIDAPESEVALMIAEYQQNTPGLEVGSYPRETAPMHYQVSLVLRHRDSAILQRVIDDLIKHIHHIGLSLVKK